MELHELAYQAKGAAIKLAAIKRETKDRALAAMSNLLQTRAQDIIAANQQDLQRAEKENLPAPLRKRLHFDQDKIDEVCAGLNSLIKLEDPAGVTLQARELDNGLELFKVSCPIGVIGVIFESRPDALVQISSLCLKSGNAILLKGGQEALSTNRILADLITQASTGAGIPHGWLALLETRSEVNEMLKLDQFLDLLIPRGSNQFVQYIMNNTNIPVLGHADGICHVYVDKRADLDMALSIAVDSKCQYVAVCNAAETLLVHKKIAPVFLPVLKEAFDQKGVEIRGCAVTQTIIPVHLATEEDWKTEYLDLTISIKVVDSLAKAIEHINGYGSGHTDVIVSGDMERALLFTDLVDSADVFVNCSSRFSDGFRYGLGAEVGISTNKIHARGPVGLEGLVIYKWKLIGQGHIVADYSGPDGKNFTHKTLDKEFSFHSLGKQSGENNE